MSQNKIDLIPLLKWIDPATLTYQEWVSVGMALKHEGYDCDVWDSWSSLDVGRYHPGECQNKWNSFNGCGTPITGGTVVEMARQNGWSASGEGRELGWDDVICDDGVIINPGWVESRELNEPRVWHPAQQLIDYLSTLFAADETVGYTTRSYEQNGRKVPQKGCYDRTAGQLIEQLSRCNDDIGAVLGDYDPQVGAWIRFNPLDGKGVKNENVTEYRYALVESDSVDLAQQNALLRELNLPIACLVHSGNKSLHAIVRVDADSYQEYRKRVDFLYSICAKNGLEIDTQNRNPSRLSRLPGVERDGKKQYIIDTNIGASSWNEWREWVEAVNDDLPDPESLADVWNSMPPLAPELISGVLRQGHKMLVAGASKAGKSYALIELCIAIAEGKRWMGFQCAQGKVMYVNLELDRASCMHRFKDVYDALGQAPDNIGNITTWHLRGRSVPMDKLAPKLIRRAAKGGYIAIIIDPIYKVITGDENSADQMAKFCNQFDKVCTELGCAVIYCHHHSKGGQGAKRSMDRASGSGVFARDPDALLDLIELHPKESVYTLLEGKEICSICCEHLRRAGHDPESIASQDDMCSPKAMRQLCREHLSPVQGHALQAAVERAEQQVRKRTAWRIEGTLREFERFKPIDLWFRYPIHVPDDTGALQDADTDDATPVGSSFRKNFAKKRTPEQLKQERAQSLDTAFACCSDGGEVSISDLAGYLGVSEKTVRNRIKENGDYWIDGGNVGKK